MSAVVNPKQVIATSAAPAALGSYSQGVINAQGSLLYTSGQIGLNPTTLQLVNGVEKQIRQTFANIEGICQAAGASLQNISKLTVYLISKDDWALVNSVMEELFLKPFPARTAVGAVWLPLGAVVEIEAVVDLASIANK
jgi:reactive intermediate/imine deaminase